MTLFYALFPSVASALWRAGRTLTPEERPNQYPRTMDRLNTAAALAIVGALITSLEITRADKKKAIAALKPAQDDLRAYKENDDKVDEVLLDAKAKLDAWAAEDAAEEQPPVEEPPTDPVPPTDPTPPTDPAPPEDPAPPADPAPPEDPAPPVDPETPPVG